MEELLSLKWNNHRSTFLHILGILRDKQLYTDATLACDGSFYSVHRLVLSTCSDYFSAMFDKTTTCKNPIIVLKDIKCADLEALLDYMYLGEVNVKQADLASLIKSAECLRVKGLAVPDDEPPKRSKEGGLKRSEGGSSPPPKRKRRDQDGQDARDDRPSRPSSGRSPSGRSKSPNSSRRRRTHSPHDNSGVTKSSPSRVPSIDDSNNVVSCDLPLVKVEPEDRSGEDIVETFPISNDVYKEEPDDNGDTGGDVGNDLQGFLQSSNSDMGDNSYGAFPGTSSYSSGDLTGWQGDGSNLNFSSQLDYGAGESSSQNAPGGDSWKMMSGRVCSICNRIFSRPSHLERHMRTHTGEKPFGCIHCPYRCNRKENLKSHVFHAHERHLMNAHEQHVSTFQAIDFP